jgi:hypothetical protein
MIQSSFAALEAQDQKANSKIDRWLDAHGDETMTAE